MDFEVANFKALRSGRLLDRRTTLVAGANSSGKTSLMQAILLSAQSLGAESLVLNGPLVTLGTPGDVLRDGAAELSLSFTWTERGPAEPKTLRYVFVPTEQSFALVELLLFNATGIEARLTRWRPPATFGDRTGDWLQLRLSEHEDTPAPAAVSFAALKPRALALEEEPGVWSRRPLRAFTDSAAARGATELAAAEGACRRVEAYLRSFVYLGPLRASPRVAYSPGYAVEGTPVGARGELAASLYERERTTLVPYRDESGRLRRRSVGEAVDLWCRYLEIAEGLHVSGEGKLGHRVSLATDGVPRDLTSIGVGASQLLPVLVLIFAAHSGSRILLEQPELHLHPGVQSRLADLFLDGRADVRVTAETHSEYLVTRLRRRVAEGVVSPTDVGLLFAERTARGSNLRQLDLDAVGDLERWPAGFFDTLDADGAYLARAVRERMRTMRGDG